MGGAPVLAELPELVERWRTLNADETAKANRLLGDASRLVVRLFPTVPARAAADESFAADAAMVVCNMVRRAMLSEPRLGVEQQSETRGPFAKSLRYSNPDGDLELTVQEQAILQDPTGATAATPVWTGAVVGEPGPELTHRRW